MKMFLFNIFLISFTGPAICMADSKTLLQEPLVKSLFRGELENQIYRQKFCKRLVPGSCGFCKIWHENPKQTARFLYRKDGIASIRVSIVSFWLIFINHGIVQFCYKLINFGNCCWIIFLNVINASASTRPRTDWVSKIKLKIKYWILFYVPGYNWGISKYRWKVR